MFVKVKNMAGGEAVLVTISKTDTIEELKSKVKDKMGVELSCQRLFYRGKQLEDKNSLFDYSVNVNEVIQLMVRQPLEETRGQENIPITERLAREVLEGVDKAEEKEVEKEEQTKKVIEEEATSEYFMVGDLVDIMDSDPGEGGTPGAWYEGAVVRVTRQQGGDEVAAGCDALTYYVKYEAYEGDDYTVKLEQLQPRARRVLKPRELTVGMDVFVPYNVTEPDARGEWYRATVEEVRPKLLVTVLAGTELLPIPQCEVLHPAEVMALELAELVGERTQPLDRPAPERKHPEKCNHCHDNDKKKCKECACQKCGGKQDPELQVVCDECQGAFHLACLKLAAMPEEDEWFCPDCKNVDDTVKVGEKMATGKKKAKMASKMSEESGRKVRDWGSGMATVGRTKVCTKVDKTHFGPVPGIEVGMSWLFRVQVSEEGIHRPHVAGIAGTATEGCPSLVLGGGYEDDVDDGDSFTYTGSGGRDLSGNKRTAPQSSDQVLTRTNAAIAVNCQAKFDDKAGADAGADWRKGKPIRVMRGWKGAKHSKFAPPEGCRYDGIYKVVRYWPQKGKSGFIVWRYELRRDDPSPAPWTKEGKAKMEAGGYAEIVKPPNHDEYMKEKARELEEKQKQKLALKEGKAEEGKVKGKVSKRKADDDDEEEASEVKKGKSKDVKAGKVVKADKVAPAVMASYKLGSPEKALLKADTLNHKLWEEVLAASFRNKKELTDKVEEIFCCMICQDLVYEPVTTPCSHNLCRNCLSRSFKAGVYSCPSCRAEMEKDYSKPVNSPLRAALLHLFPGYESGR